MASKKKVTTPELEANEIDKLLEYESTEVSIPTELGKNEAGLVKVYWQNGHKYERIRDERGVLTDVRVS